MTEESVDFGVPDPISEHKNVPLSGPFRQVKNHYQEPVQSQVHFKRSVACGRYLIGRLYRHDRTGIWQARVRDLVGDQTLRLSSGTTDGRLAVRLLKVRLAGMATQTEEEKITLTLGEVLDKFLATKRRVGAKHKRDLKYRRAVLEKHGLLSKQITSVTWEDIDGFLKTLEDKGRRFKTRRDHLSLLRATWRWGIARGFAEKDPTATLSVPRERKRAARPFTVEEEIALLAASGKSLPGAGKNRHHVWLAVLVALQTGLRKASVLGLQWGDVDFAKKELFLEGTRTKNKEDLRLPLHEELVLVLQEEKERRGKVGPKDFIITNRRLTEIHRAFKTSLRHAGLVTKETENKYRFHDLRATFATRVAEVTSNPAVVKRLLGHTLEGGDVTFAYVKPQDWELRFAIDRLPWLGRKNPRVEEEKAVTLPPAVPPDPPVKPEDEWKLEYLRRLLQGPGGQTP